jgi:DNA-binding MarR family transcriptional regulator
LTESVNGEPGPLVVVLLEHAIQRIRAELYALSDVSFPGLRTRHYRLLAMVPPEGERLSRMAGTSGLTKQALAQTLAPLQAGGYVEVAPDPSDGRARLVRLTERGRTVNETVRRHLDGVEREWAGRVGEERYATAREVLADLVPRPAGPGAAATVEE